MSTNATTDTVTSTTNEKSSTLKSPSTALNNDTSPLASKTIQLKINNNLKISTLYIDVN